MGVGLGKVLDFLLLFLSQFAGGPGPPENNLVRFGLPAVLWAILLYIAWSRQRTQHLPREKLLVWGFGLALVRELYMFGQMAYRLLGSGDVEANCEVIQPLEHGLAMAAMIVVAGAFLRYILEDPQLARRFLQIGLGITVLAFVLASWSWPRQLAAYPQLKFHQTWSAWLFHIPLSILMAVAVYLLWRRQGWLRNVVATALSFYLLSELLLLFNYATARAYNAVICPIGNSLHILAIPLLGYVYLHEQSLEKKQADEALLAYRDHLEELVNDRTAELTTVNTQLTQEVQERTLAEEALEMLTHRYQLILESAGEGICGIDLQGRMIFANPAAAQMLGYSAEDLINRSSYSILHCSNPTGSPHPAGKPHPVEECPIYQGYSQGIQRSGDDEYFSRRDGTGFPVRYFSNPIREKGELAGTVVLFQDITERKRSEAEIARRNASLATQNAVAATLSQSLEIKANLMNVLEIVRVDVEMEIGLIYLLEAGGQNLNLQLHSGLPAAKDIQFFNSTDCACQLISRQALYRTQTIISNSDDIAKNQKRPCVEEAGIHLLVSVPLVSKGRAVGVMTLGSSQKASVPAHKLELLTAIGQQIGMAIENASLYRDAESWAGELTRLHEASSYLTASFDLDTVYQEIARQSAHLLKCQKSAVTHLNSQSGQFELAAGFGLNKNELQILQDQIPGWIFLSELAEQGKTVAVQDVAADKRLPAGLRKKLKLQAALLAPVWSAENPQEFILLFDVQTSRPWHARELELIDRLANRAAVALMNARLHQQLELAAALEERQRIAANMHDGLAQTLSLLGLRVDRMQELVEVDGLAPDGFKPEMEAVTHEIREAVVSAATEVRRSIASLRQAPRPRKSLQESIRELFFKLQADAGPKFIFDSRKVEALYLSTDDAEQVMPLIQEAILNACRHARAQNVSLRLDEMEEKIHITIEDDGSGFDLATPPQDGDHFGLSIMQARAARMGADFQIDTSPGNGTRVILAWNPEGIRAWKANDPLHPVQMQARRLT